MRTTRSAQILSVVSTFGCFVMAIPPAFIGIIAKNTSKKNCQLDPHVLYKITFIHSFIA